MLRWVEELFRWLQVFLSMSETQLPTFSNIHTRTSALFTEKRYVGILWFLWGHPPLLHVSQVPGFPCERLWAKVGGMKL